MALGIWISAKHNLSQLEELAWHQLEIISVCQIDHSESTARFMEIHHVLH